MRLLNAVWDAPVISSAGNVGRSLQGPESQLPGGGFLAGQFFIDQPSGLLDLLTGFDVFEPIDLAQVALFDLAVPDGEVRADGPYVIET